MDKRDRLILAKVQKESLIVSEMIENMAFDVFQNDEKTKRAVCMTLINIGELVKLLSETIRSQNPQIPWRSISGLRDVTAHGYQTLRMDDIWVTVTVDIPKLRMQISEIK